MITVVHITIHRGNLFFASINVEMGCSHSAMLFLTIESPEMPAEGVGHEYTHHRINPGERTLRATGSLEASQSHRV
jgi:hypothetical protein